MTDGNPEPAGIQQFVLDRELAEVYLLLDHISSVDGKSIPSETDVPDPIFGVIDTAGKRAPGWLEQICAIAWPPKDMDPLQDAEDAAKLIRARDALNHAATPATGASIAFTVMMTGENAPGEPEVAESQSGPRWTGRPSPSRPMLATQAYPDLGGAARRHRKYLRIMAVAMLVWLIATALLSWDIATGSALLNRVTSTEKRIADLSTTAHGAPTPAPTPTVTRTAANAPSAPPTSTPTSPPTPASGPTPAPTPAPTATCPCGTPTSTPDRSGARILAVDQATALKLAYGDATNNLGQWLDRNFGLRWLLQWVMGGRTEQAILVGNGANIEWAAVFLGLLAGTVLPIFYGVLGAGAAVARSLSARLRDSTLTPRHLSLAYIQLGLGALIAACISLFVTPDGAGSTSEPGLLGPVHLSASALCFIAGFGVEGVFQALESLIARVFNIESPRKPANS